MDIAYGIFTHMINPDSPNNPTNPDNPLASLS